MERLDSSKNNLRKFGLIMAVAFLLIGGLIFLKQKHFPLSCVFISAAFLTLVLTRPLILKPVYIIWMGLAFLLSWVNTRLILITVYYLIFTPIGLMLKILSIDTLDRRIEKIKASYWHKKEGNHSPQGGYERQF